MLFEKNECFLCENLVTEKDASKIVNMFSFKNEPYFDIQYIYLIWMVWIKNGRLFVKYNFLPFDLPEDNYFVYSFESANGISLLIA